MTTLAVTAIAVVLEASAAPVAIMPLGDSITAGDTLNTLDQGGAYRTQLWQDLGADITKFRFTGTQVSGPASLSEKHHEGHVGFTIAFQPNSGYGNLTDNVQNYIASNPRLLPDVILLMIGTNDVNRNFEVDQAPAKLDHLISLISDLNIGFRPQAKLIVSSILPIDDANNQFRSDPADFSANARAIAFNATIPGIVTAHSARGERVFFTDIYSKFNVADIKDGLHPSPAGFNKLGDLWYSAILAVPEPSSWLLLAGGLIAAAVIHGRTIVQLRR
jgi:lysophospholipase L1-like esterase